MRTLAFLSLLLFLLVVAVMGGCAPTPVRTEAPDPTTPDETGGPLVDDVMRQAHAHAEQMSRYDLNRPRMAPERPATVPPSKSSRPRPPRQRSNPAER